MTTLTARLHQESPTWLSNPATVIIVAMMTGMTFSASGASPTPLYHLYQEYFGLTQAMVTVIFAAYVLSLLLALLTTGTLSDHIGRRIRRSVDCCAHGTRLRNRCRDRSFGCSDR